MSTEKSEKDLKKLSKYREWIQNSEYETTVSEILNTLETEIRNNPDLDRRLELEKIKKICRFVWYINNHPKDPDIGWKRTKLLELLKSFKDYDKLNAIYDEVFLKADYAKAQDLLHEMDAQNSLANPRIGSKQGMMYSYIMNKSKQIFIPKKFRAKGSYGSVKSAESPEENFAPTVIKRQSYPYGSYSNNIKLMLYLPKFNEYLAEIKAIQEGRTLSPLELARLQKIFENLKNDDHDALVKEFYWLPLLEEEARLNIELGMTDSELIVVRDEQGEIYKVYQPLRHLGTPIDTYLENHPDTSLEQKLKFAVDLLLAVNTLHSGTASNTGDYYAHRDIKPANTLIDEHGILHLIDFGLTKKSKNKNELICEHIATAPCVRLVVTLN